MTKQFYFSCNFIWTLIYRKFPSVWSIAYLHCGVWEKFKVLFVLKFLSNLKLLHGLPHHSSHHQGNCDLDIYEFSIQINYVKKTSCVLLKSYLLKSQSQCNKKERRLYLVHNQHKTFKHTFIKINKIWIYDSYQFQNNQNNRYWF